MTNNLETKTQKTDKKDPITPSFWAKTGLTYIGIGAAITFGGYKLYEKQNKKVLELNSRIPAEYFLLEKEINNFGSLNGLEFADKLQDPNFVNNYRAVVTKYHEYADNSEFRDNLNSLWKAELKSGSGEAIIVTGGAFGLTGFLEIAGAGIYSASKKLTGLFKKKNGK